MRRSIIARMSIVGEMSRTRQCADSAAARLPSPPLRLPSDLRAIFEQSYPRFSDAEYARRHAGIARAMAGAGAHHVLLVTWRNSCKSSRWMIGGPPTPHALHFFSPRTRYLIVT